MENLKPFNTLTESEKRDLARKGGKASGEARRKKKRFRELFNSVLDQKNEKTGERHDMAIVKAMINKASTGNVKAFEAIRDTTGEKPTEKQEITGKLAFKDFLEEVEKNK